MTLHNVLVTGCFGYVGSRLTPLLIKEGYQVRGLDLLLYGDAGYKALDRDLQNNFQFFHGDIRNQDLLKRALAKVDAVIHLAAISNDPTGEIDDTLTKQVNFDAVGMLLCLAKEAGVRRFINASSSSVFGIKRDENVGEELTPEPITSYSRYKMLSEWLVLAAANSNFCTVNIRPATICGVSPRQRFDLTVNKLTADAVRKRCITVHGGSQRRPNIGMTDMVNLYKVLLEVPGDLIYKQTFNFGFENLEIIKIAEKIQRQLADLDVTIQTTESFDKRDYHICSDRIVKTLRYTPVSSISQEIIELRRAIEHGKFLETEHPLYHNMKSMTLERSDRIYHEFFTGKTAYGN